MPKKKTPVPIPSDQSDEDYLRARRVNIMHQNFMRKIVVPARKDRL